MSGRAAEEIFDARAPVLDDDLVAIGHVLERHAETRRNEAPDAARQPREAIQETTHAFRNVGLDRFDVGLVERIEVFGEARCVYSMCSTRMIVATAADVSDNPRLTT